MTHAMSRRGTLVMFGGAALAGPAWAARPKAAKASVYDRSIVIDAQSAIAPGSDQDSRPPAANLADIRTSGVTAISMTIGPTGNGPDRYRDTLNWMAFAMAEVASAPAELMMILKGADLIEAKRSDRMGLIFNLQDTTALESDAGRVASLRSMGLRILQLTYNKRNLCGDGALERANAGLSDFGRETIAAINAANVLLDLSHGGQRTVAEAIAASKAPAAITHTGCRDLVDNPRNVYDRELKALADKGGVVGIYFMPFLRESGQEHSEDVAIHLEHAVNVCGEDHVGIGTDGALSPITLDQSYRNAMRQKFEDRKAAGIAAPNESADVFNYVPEYNSSRRFELLTQDLSKRGWPDARIEKVLGANFTRVFTEVWKG